MTALEQENARLKQQVKQLIGDCKSFNEDVQKLTKEIRLLKLKAIESK